MPHVLFLNRSYYPDAEATGQLLTELCEDLATHFHVAVLCGQPNQNPLALPYQKHGAESRNGVTIRRIWHTQFNKRNLFGRALNMLSFFLGTAGYATFGPRPDVVVVETDPPLLCLLGQWLKFRFRTPLIVYLQDIYPDIAIELGKLRDGWLARLLRSAFSRAYRRADQIVVLSHDMASRMAAFGVDRQRISVIPNWTDCTQIVPKKEDNSFLAELDNSEKFHQKFADKFVVMYSGNLGLCQHLETVIQAASQLQYRSNVLFLLIGDGASRKKLEQEARDRGLKNVIFLDYQPKSRLSESLSSANVHLIPLDSRVSHCLMPSKLYGILASGTPAIAVAPEDCELARIVCDEQIGYVVDPKNPLQLAQLLERLASNPQELPDMGRRARLLAEARFDRPRVISRFRELLYSLVGAPQPALADKVSS